MERVHALALEFTGEPALEHIDHLEVDVVVVRDRDFFRAERLGHADDVGLHHASRRRREAEIAIGGVGAQAVVKILVAVMADREALGLARFGSLCGLCGKFGLALFRFCLRLVCLPAFCFRHDRPPVSRDWITMPECREGATYSAHSRASGNPVVTTSVLVALGPRFRGDERWMGAGGYSAASAAPPCAFDQPAGSAMNFSTSASIFGSNLPLALATASTSFQVVSACSVTPRSPKIFLLCG